MLVTALTPLLGGAAGGCGPINSKSPAPNVAGKWAVAYDDTLEVKVTIGGAVYSAQTGPQGGSITIDHQGQPLTFDLDCSKPEVICPSEAWPAEVSAVQRNAAFPHRMFVQIPVQTCDGAVIPAQQQQCGPGTANPDCDDVCEGDLETRTVERFGVISEAGDSFELVLGAGVAGNGVNCAMLGLSLAKANLDTTGSPEAGDWKATAMRDGQIITGYAGGCLWAGDPNATGQLEALVIGATLELSTGFTGDRLN